MRLYHHLARPVRSGSVVRGLFCLGFLSVALLVCSAIGFVPPVAAQGLILFSDDFETGLDPGVWIIENVGNAEWTPTSESGNGYVYSPPMNPVLLDNRHVDIITHQDDFEDFTLTCDIRFKTESWHADQRIIYLRCTNDLAFANGYHIHFSVYKPTVTPPNYIMIYKTAGPPYVNTLLTPSVEFPWALDQWFSFKVRVVGNEIKVKVWPKGDPEPEAWFLEAVDPDATFTSGRIGFGDYWLSVTDLDNVVVRSVVETADLDIKPGSCPNPLNMTPMEEPPKNAKSRKGGVLPVAVLGTQAFDVAQIDVTTVALEGVGALRSAMEDVGTPVVDGEECECNDAGPDGFMDLTLKFEKADVAAALGAVAPGDVIPLTLTGELLDGTPFKAVDCATIVGDEDPPASVGSGVVLGPVVPNPFNPSTRISYQLPRDEFVTLAVFDAAGRLVERLVSETQSAGEHIVEWDAQGLPSGVYFYRIAAGEFTATRKMVYLK